MKYCLHSQFLQIAPREPLDLNSQTLFPKPPQPFTQNLNHILIRLKSGPPPTPLHHRVNPDRRFPPISTNHRLDQPNEALVVTLDPTPATICLQVTDQTVEIFHHSVPGESGGHVGVEGQVRVVVFRSDGGEDVESEGAVVLAQELAQGSEEVGFEEAGEEWGVIGCGGGLVSSLEGLDGVDGFDAQDAAFHEGPTVGAWAAAYGNVGGSGCGSCGSGGVNWVNWFEEEGEVLVESGRSHELSSLEWSPGE